MSLTKLIYGAGRIPRASEFSLGEIIVNVDDSKVYSKSKNNIVFQIGENRTNSGNTTGFTTASIEGSGFITSLDTPNLIISGGTGITLSTGSNNQIIITATGESEVTVTNALTASYISSTDINGVLFDFISDSEQGDIYFDTNNISVNSNVGAVAAGLSETSNVTFAQVSSSGNLFASLSLNDSNYNTVVYNPTNGQFFYTGSYAGGGGGSDNDWYIDPGVVITSSLSINVEGNISASGYLKLKSNENTTGVAGGLLYSSSNDFYLGFS
jgi:hypothetical protein